MGNFVYQTHHILERHLKIGAKMSLEEIIDDSLNGKGLDVLRGPALQIYSEETNGGKLLYIFEYTLITNQLNHYRNDDIC